MSSGAAFIFNLTYKVASILSYQNVPPIVRPFRFDLTFHAKLAAAVTSKLVPDTCEDAEGIDDLATSTLRSFRLIATNGLEHEPTKDAVKACNEVITAIQAVRRCVRSHKSSAVTECCFFVYYSSHGRKICQRAFELAKDDWASRMEELLDPHVYTQLAENVRSLSRIETEDELLYRNEGVHAL